MTRRKLIVRPLAQSQIRVARDWWRRNRDKAPEAFDDDISQALDDILSHPLNGTAVRTAKRRGLRRVLIERIRYYVYYRFTDDVVGILTVWHASRRPPKL